MAKTEFYVIINGEVSDRFNDNFSFTKQRELETHREEIRKKHDYKTGDYDIRFGIKSDKSEIGKFHT